jgi:hypothetical protein
VLTALTVLTKLPGSSGLGWGWNGNEYNFPSDPGNSAQIFGGIMTSMCMFIYWTLTDSEKLTEARTEDKLMLMLPSALRFSMAHCTRTKNFNSLWKINLLLGIFNTAHKMHHVLHHPLICQLLHTTMCFFTHTLIIAPMHHNSECSTSKMCKQL